MNTQQKATTHDRFPVAAFWVVAILAAAGIVVLQQSTGVDVAPGATVLLTAALVWTTWRYTRATEDMAETQQAQMGEFIAANKREQDLVIRAAVLEVWSFGVQHVEESALLSTRIAVFLDSVPASLDYVAKNNEVLRQDVDAMGRTADTYFAMSLGMPPALNKAMVAHQEALSDFGSAVLTMLRAVSAASRGDKTTIGLDDVERELRAAVGPQQKVLEFLALRDGSLRARCHSTYTSMMHETVREVQEIADRTLHLK